MVKACLDRNMHVFCESLLPWIRPRKALAGIAEQKTPGDSSRVSLSIRRLLPGILKRLLAAGVLDKFTTFDRRLWFSGACLKARRGELVGGRVWMLVTDLCSHAVDLVNTS